MTGQPGCQLYLISPPEIGDLTAFAKELDDAFAVGGVGAFQLRLKEKKEIEGKLTYPSASEKDILAAAEILKPICHKHNVAFILNDDPALAKKCGADGVHLGQEDASIAEARKILGDDAVIGVSCHASKHLAMEAAEQGADYVTFGAFYPTTSKSEAAQKHWGTPAPEILEWWSTYTTVPCVAIGGITPDNCAPLVKAGADFLAVITSVWGNKDGAVEGVRKFQKILQESLTPSS